MTYTRLVKHILIDLGLVALFFALASLLMRYVVQVNPGCEACPTIVGYAFWFSAILALQPAIWVEGVGTIGRVIIWLVAVVLGYLLYMRIYGIPVSSELGMNALYFVYPNIALFWLVFIISILGMTTLRIINKNAPKDDES